MHHLFLVIVHMTPAHTAVDIAVHGGGTMHTSIPALSASEACSAGDLASFSKVTRDIIAEASEQLAGLFVDGIFVKPAA
jgi:hypothetical protein